MLKRVVMLSLSKHLLVMLSLSKHLLVMLSLSKHLRPFDVAQGDESREPSC